MAPLKSIQDAEVQTVLTQWPRDRFYHPSPEAWEDQVLYFFLPDRFSDGKEHGYYDNNAQEITSGITPIYSSGDRHNALDDANLRKGWMDAGSVFVGGNLKGATSKLGYLKRLGITAVWIGPAFKQVKEIARSYHGYGIQDFLDIDPRFGTREDLQELVRAAHNLGIYVILDIILNHCGDVFAYREKDVSFTGERHAVEGWWAATRNRHPLLPFKPIEHSNSQLVYPDGAVWPAELQDPDCFHRKGDIRNWNASPEYIEGDFCGLKSFDLGSPDPRTFVPTKALLTLCEVYKFWLAFCDVDGYRIDTVKHMGDAPTAWFVREIRAFAETLGKRNLLLVGEITGPTVFETVTNTGLDAALGIGNVQRALWHVSLGRSNPSDYFSLFQNSQSSASAKTWRRDRIVTMIDDHDQIWRTAPKARFCAAPNGPALIEVALALNLCSLGIPCIYYGTEQAFDGHSVLLDRAEHHYADNFIREAMFGSAFGPFGSRNRHCFHEENKTYISLQWLLYLRAAEPALRRGDQYLCNTAPDSRWFGFPGFRSAAAAANRRAQGIVAWLRVHGGDYLLCAINTRVDGPCDAWVSVDGGSRGRAGKGVMKSLFPFYIKQVLKIETRRDGVGRVRLKVPAGGFVVYKRVANVQKRRTLFGLF